MLSALLLTACNLTMVVSGTGKGKVVSNPAGVDCASGQCVVPFGDKAQVTLTAQPDADSVFAGWTGDCAGSTLTCTLTMDKERTVTALFNLKPVQSTSACGTLAAKSDCLTPKQTTDYYVEQSIKYFQTMQSSVPLNVIPNYSKQVVRWEWRPWLLLTGFGQANMVLTDAALKLNPTSYAMMNCQAFDTQPFGRCHVVFDYNGKQCPIYEEFSFNDQGQMTFIEAWTDKPGYLPVKDMSDYWAEGEGVHRLSTKIPGLGNATGAIDLDSKAMKAAAAQDADVADFLQRANQPYAAYLKQLLTNRQELSNGCDPGA